MMNDHGKSDRLVVPKKSPNKAASAVTEEMEGRGLTKGSSLEQTTRRTQSRASVQSALERIRQVSKKDRKIRFTSLFHHVYSVDGLRDAYYRLKKDAAPGVDGQTWTEYGNDLDENLENLSGRLGQGLTEPNPCEGSSLRRQMARSGHWESPLSRTNWCKALQSRSSMPCMSPCLQVSHTVSGRDVTNTTLSML